MILDCPHCGLPADEQDRYVLESTDGPVEHIKTICVRQHVFNGPTEWLLKIDTP